MEIETVVYRDRRDEEIASHPVAQQRGGAAHHLRKVARGVGDRIETARVEQCEILEAIADDGLDARIDGAALAAVEVRDRVALVERGVGERAAEENGAAQDEQAHRRMVTDRAG